MSDAADSSNIKNVGLPIFGTGVREKDPVCGMAVDPSKAAAKQEFQGNTYYFCSKRCAQRFAKEPEKFLSAPGSSPMETAQRADTSHGVEVHRRGTAAGDGLTGKAPVALQDGSEATQTVAMKFAQYTCPMHPQILQNGPGFCP